VPHVEQTQLRHERRIDQQVARKIRAGAAAGKDPDRPGHADRVVAGVLERAPRHFEEMPMLRVHQRGIARAEAEEGGVEGLDAVELGGDGDVVGTSGEL
jgi:hypothetical protein